MITVEKADSLEAFEELKQDWNSLVESNVYPNPFITHDWLYAWWRNFGANRRLFILVVKDDSGVLGIGPFMCTVSSAWGKRTKRIQFIGTPNADYSDIPAKDKTLVIDAIFDYFASHRADWSVLHLGELSERSDTFEIVAAAARSRGFRHHVYEPLECPTYVADSVAEEGAPAAPQISKTLRKRISQLARKGILELRQLRETAAIKQALPTFFRYHINRWDGTTSPSKFLLREHRAFYEGLVDRLAPQGRIVLFELCHDSLPISYFLCFRLGRTLYLYTPAHSQYYNEFSPGRLIVPHIFDACLRKEYSELDFTRGAEQYKSAFTNRTYLNHSLRIYSNQLSCTGDRIVRSFKSSPAIRVLVGIKWVRDGLARLRSYHRHHGSRALIGAIFKRAARVIFDWNVLLMFQHQGTAPLLQAECPISFKVLGVEDIGRICSFVGCERGSRKYHVIRERFSRGGQCYAAFSGDAIASVCWDVYQKEYFQEVDWYFNMKPGEVFLADAITSPVFRGLRIYPALLSYAVKDRLAAGCRVYGACTTTNIASYKGIRAVGYTMKFKVRRLRVLGVRII